MHSSLGCEEKMEQSISDTLSNCLSRQMDEYELLKSMYPGKDEIILSDPKVIQEIEAVISGSSDFTPPHLDFVLKLVVENLKLELCINLPNFYPNEEPDVYVRCNQFNRQQESSLNCQLSAFVRENHLGEVCLYTIVTWLQDNVTSFSETEVTEKPIVKAEKTEVSDKFARYWILSHHIYNKHKREVILSTSKDFDVTGFCVPGKPGIIYIEGPDSHCKEYWRIIKAMCWKKITLRKIELFEPEERATEQKFHIFKELYFHNPLIKNSKHTDMGVLSKYMDEHGLNDAFHDFFGLYKD